jgi:outer membrane protein assembly factor BamB
MKQKSLAAFIPKVILAVSLLSILICSKALADTNKDEPAWPSWRGQNGDGISKETDWNPKALADGARVLWNVNIGPGYSNVVIQANRLYTMGWGNGESIFYCLDAATGKVLWQTPFFKSTNFPQATPAIDGDRVYGVGTDGMVLCLHAADGKILWTKDLKIDFKATPPSELWAASPVVEGDLLLVNANTRALALDRLTGDFRWGIDDEVPRGSWGSYATPVVGELNGKRYALFFGPSTLNAVDVKSGEKAWSYRHGDAQHPVADPVVVAGKVFLPAPTSGTLLDPAGNTPRIVWSSPQFSTWLPGPIAIDGYLYGTFLAGFSSVSDWTQLKSLNLPFYCIDFKTGSVAWERVMKYVSVMSAAGKLIMLDLNGTLRIAEATPGSYKELSSADVLAGAEKARTFATPPVLCEGRIYCRNFAGDLICIDVSK